MGVIERKDQLNSNVASATTLVLSGNKFVTHVTGTTTVTGIDDLDLEGKDVGAGQTRTLIFDGACPLTHNGTSFQLIGGESRTSVAGDASTFLHLGSGNWKELCRNKSGDAAVMTLISDTLLGSTTANFDLTSIAGTYTDLLIEARLRSDDNASGQEPALIRFNNDSGSNYAWNRSYSYSNVIDTVTNDAGTPPAGSTSALLGYIPCDGGTANANSFGVCRIRIPSYASVVGYKNYHCDLTGCDTQMRQDWVGGEWRSTSAITRVTIYPTTGEWVTGSRLRLFGIL